MSQLNMDVQSSVVLRNEYYRDTIRQQTTPKRLISAPYLYCSFAASIILIGVGTYVSAYAYSQKEASLTSTSLQYVGPILIGCGGVTILAMCMICVVAFRLNKGQIYYEEMDYPMAVGASTFYGQPVSPPQQEIYQDGSYNEDVMYEDGLRFLERTVSTERQRKISKNSTLPRKNTNEIMISTNMLPPIHQRNPSFRHLGSDGLRRTEPVEELSSYNENDSNGRAGTPPSRSRSMSVAHRQRPQTIQRNLSLNPKEAQIHRHNLKYRRQISSHHDPTYPPELQFQPPKNPSSPFLSLKRKKSSKKRDDRKIPVCHLPGYDPQLINDLMNKADQEGNSEIRSAPRLEYQADDCSMTEDGVLSENRNTSRMTRSTSTLERRENSEKSLDQKSHSTQSTTINTSTIERRRKKKRKTRSSLRTEFSDTKPSSGCTCSSTSDEDKVNESAETPGDLPSDADDIPPPPVNEAIGTIRSVIESQANDAEFTEFKRLSKISENGHEDDKCSRSSPH